MYPVMYGLEHDSFLMPELRRNKHNGNKTDRRHSEGTQRDRR